MKEQQGSNAKLPKSRHRHIPKFGVTITDAKCMGEQDGVAGYFPENFARILRDTYRKCWKLLLDFGIPATIVERFGRFRGVSGMLFISPSEVLDVFEGWEKDLGIQEADNDMNMQSESENSLKNRVLAGLGSLDLGMHDVDMSDAHTPKDGKKRCYEGNGASPETSSNPYTNYEGGSMYKEFKAVADALEAKGANIKDKKEILARLLENERKNIGVDF
eukprot:CAMPEP_0197535148 /NCGR_PEP_ID=MMETSP1318-20131121/49574_1 /TAXON_ID=552666 /ORGANISM="Partenskyella glossopodia, Strain RCC365" /LENGTH=217 /DNA_ID=CAMNT_0043092649 /DNA_START=289 /DNA_END=942 /DNA_ORIENTATION=-